MKNVVLAVISYIVLAVNAEASFLSKNEIACLGHLNKLFEEVSDSVPGDFRNILKGRVKILMETGKKFNNKAKEHSYMHLMEVENKRWELRINIDELCGQNSFKFDDIKTKKIFAHFIGHILDDYNIYNLQFEHRDGVTSKQIEQCYDDYQPMASVGQGSAICNYFWSRSKTFSENKNFPRNYEKNDSEAMSESFPSMFSNYLLDAKFPCQKPAQYNYLSKIFGDTFPTNPCHNSITFKLNTNNLDVMREIPLSRVWKIHYLLAGDGSQYFSKFGHSLFRVIVCAPDREKVGPECINDIESHLVLGFVAKVEGYDEDISAFKGLAGSYPMELVVDKYSNAVNNYSIVENREMYSYELNFNDYEMKQFLFNAYEVQNVLKSDSYYFLSNNCSTSGFELVARSLESPFREFLVNKSLITTPKNLLKSLRNDGIVKLATPDKLKDRFITYIPAVTEIVFKSFDDFSKSEIGQKINFQSLRKMQTSFDVYKWAKSTFQILLAAEDINSRSAIMMLAKNLFVLESYRSKYVKGHVELKLKKLFKKELDDNNTVIENFTSATLQKHFEDWIRDFLRTHPDHEIFKEMHKNVENIKYFEKMMNAKNF